VLLRARAILVAPNERSGSILPAFPGEPVKVDDSVMPEVDATYMATDHIGVELIASTTKHAIGGVRGTTGGIGRLASTWVLPPTLTVQYRFTPTRHVRPYVGAGVNYTIFWNEAASDGLGSAVGPTRVHLKDSAGWAVQAGVDMDLTRRVFLNLDVKYRYRHHRAAGQCGAGPPAGERLAGPAGVRDRPGAAPVRMAGRRRGLSAG
jgi:outer membrane protein